MPRPVPTARIECQSCQRGGCPRSRRELPRQERCLPARERQTIKHRLLSPEGRANGVDARSKPGDSINPPPHSEACLRPADVTCCQVSRFTLSATPLHSGWFASIHWLNLSIYQRPRAGVQCRRMKPLSLSVLWLVVLGDILVRGPSDRQEEGAIPDRLNVMADSRLHG
jgi:hypothetical protein